MCPNSSVPFLLPTVLFCSECVPTNGCSKNEWPCKSLMKVSLFWDLGLWAHIWLTLICRNLEVFWIEGIFYLRRLDFFFFFFLARYHWVLPMDHFMLVTPQCGVPRPQRQNKFNLKPEWEQDSCNSQGKFLPTQRWSQHLNSGRQILFFCLSSSRVSVSLFEGPDSVLVTWGALVTA